MDDLARTGYILDMSERTKIIVEKYPVSQLPPELQQGLDRDSIARITIETTGEADSRSLRSFIGSAPGLYPTPEDALSAIRQLRDEWE